MNVYIMAMWKKEKGMKRIRFWICLLLVVLFCISSQGADRYIFVARFSDKSNIYIDTQSVRYVNSSVIRFWDKVHISSSGRKRRISSTSDRNLKKVLERLAKTQSFVEMNLVQNTYRTIELIYYDAEGHVIYSDKSWENWSNIPPNSIIECERDIVLYLLNRSSQIPSYTPTPAPTQPPIRTPNDQKEYHQLQEYYQWLSHQPDYPEFDRWISQKFVTLGITARDLNSYLIGYINGGGRYVDIQGMVAGWYREFYQERYGSR